MTAPGETEAVLDLNPDELLTTTRSVRLRLDLTRPVAPESLEACLDIAQQAPTGGNQQCVAIWSRGGQRVAQPQGKCTG